DDFLEAQVFDALAQVDEAFDDRHAGTGELLEVETEIDQVLALDAAPADQTAFVRGRRAADEIQPHPGEALLQVEYVARVGAADHRLARRINRLVRVQRHGAR